MIKLVIPNYTLFDDVFQIDLENKKVIRKDINLKNNIKDEDRSEPSGSVPPERV